MMFKAHLVVALALFAGFRSCAPWTVRPIASEKGPPATAAAYVDSLWAAKLVPAVKNGAVDARTLLDAIGASQAAARSRYAHCESGDCYFLVKGTGTVLSVDTRSRVGLALVDVAPLDRRPDVSIQIGPVLHGNSLRDATGLVRFTDFINQLQFADAGNEINDRVLKTVLAPLSAADLKGRDIAFAGAVAAQDRSSPPLAEVVPVELTVGARR
jgi:predicted lipoprotein